MEKARGAARVCLGRTGGRAQGRAVCKGCGSVSSLFFLSLCCSGFCLSRLESRPPIGRGGSSVGPEAAVGQARPSPGRLPLGLPAPTSRSACCHPPPPAKSGPFQLPPRARAPRKQGLFLWRKEAPFPSPPARLSGPLSGPGRLARPRGLCSQPWPTPPREPSSGRLPAFTLVLLSLMPFLELSLGASFSLWHALLTK